MSLHGTIQNTLKEAMLKRDAFKVTVLRGVLAAFMNELIAKKSSDKELSDADATAVIKRLTKQRKDSITQFKAGGREDLVKNEEAELVVLESYMPSMMSKADIKKTAITMKEKLKVTDKTKLGALVGAVMKELKGKADGGDVKAVVESLFE
jgi:uncharacterized protein YqeY